ncbi:MAG: recombinase A [Acidobacteriota bacterium]
MSGAQATGARSFPDTHPHQVPTARTPRFPEAWPPPGPGTDRLISGTDALPALDDIARISPASRVVPAMQLAPALRRPTSTARSTADTLDWSLPLFTGHLGEISGSHAAASLSFAFRLVHDAQRRQEPVAWIQIGGRLFFPPDVADAGIDLAALAIVQAPAFLPAARAADHLVRSGGFGLVVLDVGAGANMSLPVQSRLAGLARKHETALLCLTEKNGHQASLGPLVSLRVETRRRQRCGNRFRCEVRVLKDKRHGPGRVHVEVCRGPAGLC